MTVQSVWVLWWIEWQWDRFLSVIFGLSLSGLRIPVEAGNVSCFRNAQTLHQSPYLLCYPGPWWNGTAKRAGVRRVRQPELKTNLSSSSTAETKRASLTWAGKILLSFILTYLLLTYLFTYLPIYIFNNLLTSYLLTYLLTYLLI